MPTKPKGPCRWPGCPHLAEKGGYCLDHLRKVRSGGDMERGTAAQRGYDYRWQRYRQVYLAAHRLCVRCLEMEPQRITEATVVDHIIPHRGDRKLFWDTANHQSLCRACHDRKTATEDGAFGNVPPNDVRG